MSEALIDYLSEECDLYISDLNRPELFPVILPVIEDLSVSRFSAEDWSASLSYLFKKSLKFENSESAKNYCIKTLLKSSINTKNRT